eukprot:TRINITY_DN61385_c0_g1_i1.p1 TRINITY_DN61385_c0_g1~~TRINITY_DN61385_c0_g1_i1.p1  ORF type:complete len:2810 (-),score=546.98 TRINITY_DN61385_c0_g1_i1:206-8635(-)
MASSRQASPGAPTTPKPPRIPSKRRPTTKRTVQLDNRLGKLARDVEAVVSGVAGEASRSLDERLLASLQEYKVQYEGAMRILEKAGIVSGDGAGIADGGGYAGGMGGAASDGLVGSASSMPWVEAPPDPAQAADLFKMWRRACVRREADLGERLPKHLLSAERVRQEVNDCLSTTCGADSMQGFIHSSMLQRLGTLRCQRSMVTHRLRLYTSNNQANSIELQSALLGSASLLNMEIEADHRRLQGLRQKEILAANSALLGSIVVLLRQQLSEDASTKVIRDYMRKLQYCSVSHRARLWRKSLELRSVADMSAEQNGQESPAPLPLGVHSRRHVERAVQELGAIFSCGVSLHADKGKTFYHQVAIVFPQAFEQQQRRMQFAANLVSAGAACGEVSGITGSTVPSDSGSAAEVCFLRPSEWARRMPVRARVDPIVLQQGVLLRASFGATKAPVRVSHEKPSYARGCVENVMSPSSSHNNAVDWERCVDSILNAELAFLAVGDIKKVAARLNDLAERRVGGSDDGETRGDDRHHGQAIPQPVVKGYYMLRHLQCRVQRRRLLSFLNFCRFVQRRLVIGLSEGGSSGESPVRPGTGQTKYATSQRDRTATTFASSSRRPPEESESRERYWDLSPRTLGQLCQRFEPPVLVAEDPEGEGAGVGFGAASRETVRRVIVGGGAGGDDIELEVIDETGRPIMHAAALDDLASLEREMVCLGSYFIHKFEEAPSVTEVERMRVDRNGVLFDLYNAEVWFSREKSKLLEVYMEIFEHTADPLERWDLTQRIVDVMSTRPRLDLEETYFTDAYAVSIACIKARTTLLRQLLRFQVKTERAIVLDAARGLSTQMPSSSNAPVVAAAAAAAAAEGSSRKQFLARFSTTSNSAGVVPASVTNSGSNDGGRNATASATPGRNSRQRSRQPSFGSQRLSVATASSEEHQTSVDFDEEAKSDSSGGDWKDDVARSCLVHALEGYPTSSWGNSTLRLHLMPGGEKVSVDEFFTSASLVWKAELIVEGVLQDLAKHFHPTSPVMVTYLERSVYNFAMEQWRLTETEKMSASSSSSSSLGDLAKQKRHPHEDPEILLEVLKEAAKQIASGQGRVTERPEADQEEEKGDDRVSVMLRDAGVGVLDADGFMQMAFVDMRRRLVGNHVEIFAQMAMNLLEHIQLRQQVAEAAVEVMYLEKTIYWQAVLFGAKMDTKRPAPLQHVSVAARNHPTPGTSGRLEETQVVVPENIWIDPTGPRLTAGLLRADLGVIDLSTSYNLALLCSNMRIQELRLVLQHEVAWKSLIAGAANFNAVLLDPQIRQKEATEVSLVGPARDTLTDEGPAIARKLRETAELSGSLNENGGAASRVPSAAERQAMAFTDIGRHMQHLQNPAALVAPIFASAERLFAQKWEESGLSWSDSAKSDQRSRQLWLSLMPCCSLSFARLACDLNMRVQVASEAMALRSLAMCIPSRLSPFTIGLFVGGGGAGERKPTLIERDGQIGNIFFIPSVMEVLLLRAIRGDSDMVGIVFRAQQTSEISPLKAAANLTGTTLRSGYQRSSEGRRQSSSTMRLAVPTSSLPQVCAVQDNRPGSPTDGPRSPTAEAAVFGPNMQLGSIPKLELEYNGPACTAHRILHELLTLLSLRYTICTIDGDAVTLMRMQRLARFSFVELERSQAIGNSMSRTDPTFEALETLRDEMSRLVRRVDAALAADGSAVGSGGTPGVVVAANGSDVGASNGGIGAGVWGNSIIGEANARASVSAGGGGGANGGGASATAGNGSIASATNVGGSGAGGHGSTGTERVLDVLSSEVRAAHRCLGSLFRAASRELLCEGKENDAAELRRWTHYVEGLTSRTAPLLPAEAARGHRVPVLASLDILAVSDDSPSAKIDRALPGGGGEACEGLRWGPAIGEENAATSSFFGSVPSGGHIDVCTAVRGVPTASRELAAPEDTCLRWDLLRKDRQRFLACFHPSLNVSQRYLEPLMRTLLGGYATLVAAPSGSASSWTCVNSGVGGQSMDLDASPTAAASSASPKTAVLAGALHPSASSSKPQYEPWTGPVALSQPPPPLLHLVGSICAMSSGCRQKLSALRRSFLERRRSALRIFGVSPTVAVDIAEADAELFGTQLLLDILRERVVCGQLAALPPETARSSARFEAHFATHFPPLPPRVSTQDDPEMTLVQRDVRMDEAVAHALDQDRKIIGVLLVSFDRMLVAVTCERLDREIASLAAFRHASMASRSARMSKSRASRLDKRGGDRHASKQDIVLWAMNYLRRCTTFVQMDDRFPAGEYAYVIHEEDLNKCVECLLRKVAKWGVDLVRTREEIAEQIVAVQEARAATLKQEKWIQTNWPRTSAEGTDGTGNRGYEALVKREVAQRGCQLVFEVDRINRSVQDLRVVSKELEYRLSSEIWEKVRGAVELITGHLAVADARFREGHRERTEEVAGQMRAIRERVAGEFAGLASRNRAVQERAEKERLRPDPVQSPRPPRDPSSVASAVVASPPDLRPLLGIIAGLHGDITSQLRAISDRVAGEFAASVAAARQAEGDSDQQRSRAETAASPVEGIAEERVNVSAGMLLKVQSVACRDDVRLLRLKIEELTERRIMARAFHHLKSQAMAQQFGDEIRALRMTLCSNSELLVRLAEADHRHIGTVREFAETAEQMSLAELKIEEKTAFSDASLDKRQRLQSWKRHKARQLAHIDQKVRDHQRLGTVDVEGLVREITQKRELVRKLRAEREHEENAVGRAVKQFQKETDVMHDELRSRQRIKTKSKDKLEHSRRAAATSTMTHEQRMGMWRTRTEAARKRLAEVEEQNRKLNKQHEDVLAED